MFIVLQIKKTVIIFLVKILILYLLGIIQFSIRKPQGTLIRLIMVGASHVTHSDILHKIRNTQTACIS